MKEINSHILKLTGKAELPSAIEPGNNFHISLEGSVPSVSENDNDDGTWNRVYTFKPIKIEVLTPTGETIKAKDTRSNSTLIRQGLWRIWANAASSMNFDEYYDTVCKRGILPYLNEAVDRAGL